MHKIGKLENVGSSSLELKIKFTLSSVRSGITGLGTTALFTLTHTLSARFYIFMCTVFVLNMHLVLSVVFHFGFPELVFQQDCTFLILLDALFFFWRRHLTYEA